MRLIEAGKLVWENPWNKLSRIAQDIRTWGAENFVEFCEAFGILYNFLRQKYAMIFWRKH